MKAFLMYKDRDFDLRRTPPWNEQALIQDLELNSLFNAMALDDEFLFEVAKSAVLAGLNNDLDTIRYRQNVLMDCLKNSSIVRDIYAIAVGAIEGEKKNYWGFSSRYPTAILHRAIEVLQMFVTMLHKLKNLADEHADKFESEGFTAFFAMLKKELSNEYFARVENHLTELKFRDVHPRDESGAKALSELNNRGVNLVANALAKSTDHILSFFNMLRAELAFYLGSLNLHERLSQKEEPTCFPVPMALGQRRHSFNGLYDVCLALSLKQRVVGNDVNADNRNLVIITGANEGGKSTLLRSIGLSQLMMQAGMFAPAESFSSDVCDGLFTHYKREEDVTMKSGKLDEELSRMSDIVDKLTSSSMLLFNESFAATNEREGSEIARQIMCGLLEKRIKIFFVTHLYEFAHGFYPVRPK
jgi:hypothetical protein